MADFEMRNISKSFGETHALVKAEFSANKGDVMGLLGENGAGKSTLVKVLCGITHEDEGEVTLYGKKLLRRNPREAMNEGIRVVHQELSLIPYATVAENIYMTELEGPFKRQSLKALNAKAKKLFDILKIKDIDPGEYVGNIALAKRQKIEIVKALAFDSDIVVFDESTSALTEADVEWLFDLIENLSKQGKIIVFISHRMQEVNRVCNRFTIFRNGEFVGEFAKDEIDTDQMIMLMLGRKIAGYYPEKKHTRSDEVLLHVENLRYGKALNGVTLDLHAGEIIGIGGLSGQGQAEFFNSIFGALPASGEIRIKGQKKKITHTSTALKNGIALVPEDRGNEGLVLALPVKENISMASLDKIKKGLFLSASKEKELVDDLMQKVQIKAASRETPVSTLSGGNQQKVVFAKELMSDPEILLMYDITRGVDVGTKREMFDLMLDQCRKGKGILFYSTDTEELVHMCDSIYVMFDGQLKEHLTGDAMTEENIIRASIGAAAG